MCFLDTVDSVKQAELRKYLVSSIAFSDLHGELGGQVLKVDSVRDYIVNKLEGASK